MSPLLSQISADRFSTESSWYRTWDLSWWWVALALVGFLVLGSWAYQCFARRHRGVVGILVAFRWCLMSSLFVLAMGWYPKSMDVESPEILICLDLSESMAQRMRSPGTHGGETTRLEAVVDLVNKSELGSQSKWNVSAYSIGDELAELEFADGKLAGDLLPLEKQSRLGDGLQQLLTQITGRPVAAVVLLTDGVTTQGKTLQQMDRLLQRSDVPIFTVALDPKTSFQDASLGYVISPAHALVGENVLFEVPVLAESLAGKELVVQMLRAADGELLQEQKWIPDSSHDEAKLEFLQVIDLPGPHTYRFEVQFDGDDFNRTNDEQRIQIQAHEMQQRVLVVAGTPSWEYRFLKHTIERSVREVEQSKLAPFQLHVLLQDAASNFSEIDGSALSVFPVSVAALEQYDVIMLLNPLTAQESPTRGLGGADCEHLLEYVQSRSGNLVWVAGAGFNAAQWSHLGLGPLLPAGPADFLSSVSFLGPAETVGVQRSQLGAAMGPLQLQRVDSRRPFEWKDDWRTGQFVLPTQVKPGTRVLLESSEVLPVQQKPAPLLLFRNVGAGSVLFQGFDEAYYLRYQRGDEVLNAYWSQWIQYLAKRKWLSQKDWQELRTDRSVYLEGEPVQVIAQSVGDEGAEGRIEVSVLSDLGFQTELGLLTGKQGPLDFTGELVGLVAGNYRVQLENRQSGEMSETQFVVRSHPDEDEVKAVNRVGLAHVARVSGGELVELDDLSRMSAWLPPGSPRVVGQRVGTALWDRALWLGGFGAVWAGLLVLEWSLRDWKRP